MESGCDYSSYFSYTDFILYLGMMVPAQIYHKMITSTYIPGDGFMGRCEHGDAYSEAKSISALFALANCAVASLYLTKALAFVR